MLFAYIPSVPRTDMYVYTDRNTQLLTLLTYLHFLTAYRNCSRLIIFVVIIFLLLAICVLVGVAFTILLERRVLGYVHIRKGPNKVGFIGLFQPFSDAINLLETKRFLNTI
jgi:NADH:ubiquinone oxidoreductase subunit H